MKIFRGKTSKKQNESHRIDQFSSAMHFCIFQLWFNDPGRYW